MHAGYFLLGFAAKVITGLDDMVTRVPIIASVTKTRRGEIIFAAGSFIALAIVVLLAEILTSYIYLIPHSDIIMGLMMFLLAGLIYADVFVRPAATKAEKKVVKMHPKRAVAIFGVGLASSFATLIDDLIVFASIFSVGGEAALAAAAGVLVGGLAQIAAVIGLGDLFDRLHHADDIAAGGLVLLGIAFLLGFI